MTLNDVGWTDDICTYSCPIPIYYHHANGKKMCWKLLLICTFNIQLRKTNHFWPTGIPFLYSSTYITLYAAEKKREYHVMVYWENAQKSMEFRTLTHTRNKKNVFLQILYFHFFSISMRHCLISHTSMDSLQNWLEEGRKIKSNLISDNVEQNIYIHKTCSIHLHPFQMQRIRKWVTIHYSQLFET